MYNHGLSEDLPEGKGVGTTSFLEGKMINPSVRRLGAVNFGNRNKVRRLSPVDGTAIYAGFPGLPERKRRETAPGRRGRGVAGCPRLEWGAGDAWGSCAGKHFSPTCTRLADST